LAKHKKRVEILIDKPQKIELALQCARTEL
jgi:hypothetical protein